MNNETKSETDNEEQDNTRPDLPTAAQSLLASLSDLGYTREDSVCILAMANTIIQTNLVMHMILQKATVIKAPMQGMKMTDPSRN